MKPTKTLFHKFLIGTIVLISNLITTFLLLSSEGQPDETPKFPVYTAGRMSIRFPEDVDFFRTFEIFLNNREEYEKKFAKWTTNYSTILEPKSFCRVQENTELIVLVKSTHDKPELRKQIRKNWGNHSCYSNLGMKAEVIFTLGGFDTGSWVPNLESQKLLAKEHEKFGDLLQFNFLDAQGNLTMKTATILGYITQRCSTVKFVAMLDEDYVVNPMKMVSALRSVHPLHYQRFLGGKAYDYSRVSHGLLNWESNMKAAYPYEFAPRYIFGGTILMSMHVAKLLYAGLPLLPYMPNEDLSIGIVAMNFAITPTDIRGVNHPLNDTLQYVISKHGYETPESQETEWKWAGIRCDSMLEGKTI